VVSVHATVPGLSHHLIESPRQVAVRALAPVWAVADRTAVVLHLVRSRRQGEDCRPQQERWQREQERNQCHFDAELVLPRVMRAHVRTVSRRATSLVVERRWLAPQPRRAVVVLMMMLRGRARRGRGRVLRSAAVVILIYMIIALA
jgi:hypothetical protein